MSATNTGSSIISIAIILAFIAWILMLSVGALGLGWAFLPTFGVLCVIKLLWAVIHL